MQGKLETRVGIFVLVALAIFAYMGFQIGAFRFDKSKYAPYIMYFKDISGLGRKADVKIAGVKVGWVEDFTLLADGTVQAEAKVMVLKEYVLHSDAYAIVRQDGLLGPKFLEIVPGDPLLPPIQGGGTLTRSSIEPASVDELLQSFKRIAANVENVTDSFRSAVGGVQGEEQLQQIFNNLAVTSENMASLSGILNNSFTRNEDNIDQLLALGEHVRQISDQLQTQVMPAFQDSIEKIANVFDRDFNRVADKFSVTADALQDASIQARDGFASLTSITEKIDEGKGLVGKLINEDETYYDLKVAVEGLKDYFNRANMLEIIFDGHGETMYRPSENYKREDYRLYEDSKFFFDMRIHPNQDHFYLVELATSERGSIQRTQQIKQYYKDGVPVDTNEMILTDRNKLEDVYDIQNTVLQRNVMRLGLQFGKIFNDVAMRVGLFEGTGGIALDYDIPLGSDRFRWVTSFELYDLTGWNRYNDRTHYVDRRPHAKWLNKMYFMRNVYFTFGADDFASRDNANPFFGAGLRFGDDDIKYLLPSFSGLASGMGK